MFRKNGNFAKIGWWWAAARACRLGDPLERKPQEGVPSTCLVTPAPGSGVPAIPND
jgi:hypothetical protein